MKKIITTDKAPAPIGPYNQAVLSDNTLYISGQIALNPETGNLILDTIKTETTQVMSNLKEILLEAGMTFEDVIKSTIFLINMDDFNVVNEIYGSYFNDATAPARETVAVSTLPKNVHVEISMIAKK